MTIASLVVKLSANVAEFHREMESAARRIERTGRVIAKAGREMSMAISLPLIAAGFAAFHALLQESTQQFGPLFAAFASLKGEIHKLFLSIGHELQPIFLAFIDLLRSGVGIIQSWVDAFHRLSPTMQKVIVYTLTFLAALGPTLLVVGKLIAAVGAMIKVFLMLLTPTGLIAAAIIALAAAALYVATHWEAVRLRLMAAWTAVQEAVYDSVRGILSAFAVLIEGATHGANSLANMPGLAGEAFKAMGAGLATAADAIHGLQKRFDVFADQSLAKSAAKIIEFQKALDEANGKARGFTNEALAIDEVMKKLTGDLERAHRLAQAMGITYNFAAEKARLYQAAIKELVDKGVNPLSGAVQVLAEFYLGAADDAAEFARALTALGPTLQQQLTAAKQYREMLGMGISPHIATEAMITEGKIIQGVMSGIADGLETIAARIGDIFGGVAQGFHGFLAEMGAVLGGVLKMIGKQMIELGVVAIMYGKLGLAIKHFAKNPLAAIAVGAALIALGSALGAQATRIANSGGDSGGGGGGSSYSSSSGSGGSDQGPTTIVLRLESPDGLVDSVFRDPRNQVALAKVFEDLTGRDVIIQPMTWRSES